MTTKLGPGAEEPVSQAPAKLGMCGIELIGGTMKWKGVCVLAAAVAMASGCGGSSGDANSARELTEAQFVSRANAVCVRELRRLGKEGKAGQSSQFSAVIDHELAELSRLVPPEKLTEEFAAYKETVDARRDLTVKALAAPRGVLPRALLDTQVEESKKGNELRRVLGIDSCP